jgi:hypothetical protein
MHRKIKLDDQYRSPLLHWTGTILGIVWALPLTLVGLVMSLPILLWRGRLQRCHEATPALIVSGPLADFMLAHHPFGAMCAMAVGHIVIADKSGLTRQILTHELTHVRQAAVWGILFPFAYVACSLWAVLRGHDAYWYNFFEIAARKAERHW